MRVLCVGGSPSDELVMSSLRRLRVVSESYTDADSYAEVLLSVCEGVGILLFVGEGH